MQTSDRSCIPEHLSAYPMLPAWFGRELWEECGERKRCTYRGHDTPTRLDSPLLVHAAHAGEHIREATGGVGVQFRQAGAGDAAVFWRLFGNRIVLTLASSSSRLIRH